MLAADVPRRRLLASEVLLMLEQGILREDEPVELIEGELVIVSPQGPLHSSRVMAVAEVLAKEFSGMGRLRVQMPLAAAADSLPEPDVAVVSGEPDDYRERHPGGADVLLVVEIAKSSQKLDREKASVYARAGTPVYWLVDLAARRIEERSEPSPSGEYAVTRVFGPTDSITLPTLGRSIPVLSLLGQS